MKRSTAVKLVLAGTGALALYAVTREPQCRQINANQPPVCEPARSSSGSSGSGGSGSRGGSTWWWSSSSTTPGGAPSRNAALGTISRGGFGHTGTAISASHGGS